MSELKPIHVNAEIVDGVEVAPAFDYYECEPVDKYISELKAENDAVIAELKQKLESVQDSMYCDVVDANMKNRKLQRALWLARAERANEIHFMWCQFIYDRKYGIVKFNIKKDWGENIKKGQTLHTAARMGRCVG